MEAKTPTECKELLAMDERLALLLSVANEYRDDPKALGICAKLVAAERKRLRESKAPVSVRDLHALQWRYDDFCDILQRLKKTKDATMYGKAQADLGMLREKTEEEIRALKSQEGKTPTVAEKAQELAGKVADGVRGTVDKIKKMFAGDESSK